VFDFGNIGHSLSIWLIPLVLAITFHEAAHGFAAAWFGDDTARRQGRVTLNPLAHVDLWGTVIIPLALLLLRAGFIFGYAKPVPVNWRNLRNPKRDMVWVALAGPAMNIVLALGGAILLIAAAAMPGAPGDWVARNLDNLILVNLFLALFNLIPIPPLDGGRIAVGLLPPGAAVRLARLEPFGIFIVIGVFLLLPGLLKSAGIAFDPFWTLVIHPTLVLHGLLT